MKLFVGMDVSLEKSALCVLSEHGEVVKEAEVAFEPEAISIFLGALEGEVALIGLKVSPTSRGRFHIRIPELVDDNAMLSAATEPMLAARAALRQELAGLERPVRQLAENDPVCRLLRSMPGIGAVGALTFKSAVDDPSRFRSLKRVGPWVGLTPSRNQPGERDVMGNITKAGDANLLRALRQAATVMMHRGRPSWLRTRASHVAKRRGRKIAMVALARRIAVVLHRMWRDGTTFEHAAPPMVT